MSAIKPKFDFYENAAFLDDPQSSDLARKPKAIAHKIGTEPRVSIFVLVYGEIETFFRCN